MPSAPFSRLARIVGVSTPLILLLAAPRTATAQIELSVYAGGFFPTADHVAESIATSPGSAGFEEPDPPDDTSIVQLKQDLGVSVGARLTWWFSRVMGAEVAILYNASDAQREHFQTTPLLPESSTHDAHLLGFSGRLLAGVWPSDPLSVHAVGGVGSLAFGGRAYEEFDGTSTLAFIVGAGARLRVSPAVSIRVDLEDYITSPDFQRPAEERRREGNPPPASLAPHELRDQGTQHYLVFSQSISITLTGF